MRAVTVLLLVLLVIGTGTSGSFVMAVGWEHEQRTETPWYYDQYSPVRLEPALSNLEPLSEPEEKIIDGSLDDWSPSEIIAMDSNNIYPGANLYRMYVATDERYLYIAIETNNTENWDVAYEIALDFSETLGGEWDWWRNIRFSEYKPDFMLMFHWNPSTMAIDDARFANKIEGWWSDFDVEGIYAYAGDNEGLHVLEVAIRWDTLEGIHPNLNVMAWVSGAYSDSSAVETLPDDPAVHDGGDEWTDQDDLTNFATVHLEIPGVETWNGTWSQNGGTIPVDHPIIITGNVSLSNVTLEFTGEQGSSLLQVEGSLVISNSVIVGNNIGRILNLGKLRIYESKVQNVSEINLYGPSVLDGNSFEWQYEWDPIRINSIGGTIIRNNVFIDYHGRVIWGSWRSSNITIENNTFVTFDGILDIWGGDNINIVGNILRVPTDYGGYSPRPAISISGNYLTITNNTMDYGGISISWVHGDLNIEDNYVGDLPVVFINGESHAGISGEFAQIIVYHSEDYTISNSVIGKKTERTYLVTRGVTVLDSNNVSITGCNITAYETGVYLWVGRNTRIENNNVYVPPNVGGYHVGAVSIDVSEHVTMRNNKMASGVFLIGWDEPRFYTTHEIDTSNKIGNRSILYISNAQNVTIEGNEYGQILIANVTNVVIKNAEWHDSDGLNYNYPIQVMYGRDVTLENITVDTWWGLRDAFHRVDEVAIQSSFIRGDIWLEEWDIDQALIENNELERVYLRLDNATIRNNVFRGNGDWRGLTVRGNKNIIVNNRIEGYDNGIWLEGRYNVISGNTITGNWRGISLFDNAAYNLIYNNFFNNTVNAWIEPDASSVNYWNSTIGNYWSDYNGSDINGDDIGDSPYIIDQNNVDYKPLMSWPHETPECTPSFVLHAGNVKARVNTTSELSVWLENVTTTIGALQFNLTYDPEIIEITNVTFGSAAEGSITNFNLLNGTVVVGVVSVNGITNPGELVRIQFRAKTAGETPITIEVTDASDINVEPFECFVVIPGSVTVYNRLPGDANGDGRVTAVDALIYLRFAVGLDISPYHLDPIADDMTGDGRITAVDALKVLRIAVGLEQPET